MHTMIGVIVRRMRFGLHAVPSCELGTRPIFRDDRVLISIFEARHVYQLRTRKFHADRRVLTTTAGGEHMQNCCSHRGQSLGFP
jgi:hypothetical protein